ncbi:hypothetical protein EJV47_20035 [Hymenobacter gummosus]|uniref:STAS/SEC14 domain-containing protein n=1 Tax=Hymenobacter gummosus TaxID=1776032 RepID=A0A431TYD3_9BACT|nr:hypothetical protein [Hymenobacter gummosus]RTQ47187.1 hypothetical protein EJV47_20035 [Hymenobacter gummosus]
MHLELLVDRPELVISYDAANDWLYADWRGPHDAESSRACCMLLLETLRRHPARKLLNDNSNITRQTMQLSEWSIWWVEQMAQAGMRYIAWIFPRSFDHRPSTEQIVKFIPRPAVAAFDDVASAYTWLQQQA